MEISLGQLLKKYSSLVPEEERVRELCVLVVKEVCGISLKKEDISFNKGCVFVRTSPHTKGVLYRNKKEVIENLRKSIDIPIKDIR